MQEGLFLYTTGPKDRRDAQGSAVLINGRIFATSEGQVFSGHFEIVDDRLIGNAALIYEIGYGPTGVPHTVAFEGAIKGDAIHMDCIPNDNPDEPYTAVLTRLA
jgi:hypothetical protein